MPELWCGFRGTPQDVQALAEALSWKYQAGVIVVHLDFREAVIFISGRMPAMLDISTAITCISKTESLGIVICGSSLSYISVL